MRIHNVTRFRFDTIRASRSTQPHGDFAGQAWRQLRVVLPESVAAQFDAMTLSGRIQRPLVSGQFWMEALFGDAYRAIYRQYNFTHATKSDRVARVSELLRRGNAHANATSRALNLGQVLVSDTTSQIARSVQGARKSGESFREAFFIRYRRLLAENVPTLLESLGWVVQEVNFHNSTLEGMEQLWIGLNFVHEYWHLLHPGPDELHAHLQEIELARAHGVELPEGRILKESGEAGLRAALYERYGHA